MQLTTPTATAGLTKSPVLVFASDTTSSLILAHYADRQPTVATPVSQQQADQPTTWF